METIVEVKNLRKTFGKQEVLKGISFTIKEHEVTFLLVWSEISEKRYHEQSDLPFM